MKVSVSLQKDKGVVECEKGDIASLLLKTLQTVIAHKKLASGNVKKHLQIIRDAKQLSVDINITDDKAVRKLNKQYRKLDKKTDVLSFSTLDAGVVPHSAVHLGDIVISSPMVRMQAKRFKVTEERELQRLLVHGFLHLLGFDHVHVSAKVRDEMRFFEDSMITSLSPAPKQQPIDALVAALEQKLLALKPKNKPGSMDNYIGGGKSALKFLGLTSPQVREVLKVVSKEYQFDVQQLSGIFKGTNIFELRSLVLNYIDKHRNKFSQKNLFSMLKTWVPHIDNWALSDGLSSFYAYCLEHEPALVLPILKKWNKHKKEWFIRQSLVSLLYYASQRKRVQPFKICAELVKPHLRSEYPYVQKAVGWTLRELRNVYPQETEKFLEKHIKDIRGYAFSAATEKMTRQRKEYFKKLKKLA